MSSFYRLTLLPSLCYFSMWDSKIFCQKPTNLHLGKNFIQSITPSHMTVTILKIRIVILHHKSIHTYNSPTLRIFTSASSCQKKLLISYGATSIVNFLGSSLAIDINSTTHLASTVKQCPCVNYGYATFSYILFHGNSVGSYHAIRIYILPYKENSSH